MFSVMLLYVNVVISGMYFKYILSVKLFFSCIFRSTPPSRPNNIREGLKCPSLGMFVRTYVHPQEVFLISMKFGM